MIGVFRKPALSSAGRMAATWPSIIADGAIMSAPAAAATTACLPRFSMRLVVMDVAFVDHAAMAVVVYSQKQVSEITTTSRAPPPWRADHASQQPVRFQVSLPISSL